MTVQHESLANWETAVDESTRPLFRDLVARTDAFCEKHLDEECRDICRDLLLNMFRSELSLARGKREGWAAGAVYAFTSANFINQPYESPYVPTEKIAEEIGVSMATLYKRGHEIRDTLGIVDFDPDFCLSDRAHLGAVARSAALLQPVVVQPGGKLARMLDRISGPGGFVVEPIDLEEVEYDEGPEPTGQVFHLQATLREVPFPVWRELLVPDQTLYDLHDVLQAAFGWDNFHMYEYRLGRRCFLDPNPDYDLADTEPTTQTLISDFFEERKRKVRLEYVYDFGDEWRHELVFTRDKSTVPEGAVAVCLDGGGACPPEDCGGPWGYADMLETRDDPDHEMYDDFADWLPKNFDPLAFNVKAAAKRLAKLASN